jgi:hypothetical protein
MKLTDEAGPGAYKEELAVLVVSAEGWRSIRYIRVLWVGGAAEAQQAAETGYLWHRRWVDVALIAMCPDAPVVKSVAAPKFKRQLPPDVPVHVHISGTDHELGHQTYWPKDNVEPFIDHVFREEVLVVLRNNKTAEEVQARLLLGWSQGAEAAAQAYRDHYRNHRRWIDLAVDFMRYSSSEWTRIGEPQPLRKLSRYGLVFVNILGTDAELRCPLVDARDDTVQEPPCRLLDAVKIMEPSTANDEPAEITTASPVASTAVDEWLKHVD